MYNYSFKKATIFGVCLVLFFSAAFISSGFAEEKQIKIKVAQYPEMLDFNCAQGASWELGGQIGSIAGGDACKVNGTLESKARRLYKVMVISVNISEKDSLSEIENELKILGYPVKTTITGKKVFSDNGKTLLTDNRMANVEAGAFENKADAQALVDKLAAQGKSSWIYEEIVSLSKGSLNLYINGKFMATGNELAILPRQNIHLKKVEYGAGYSWHGYADRDYRGSMVIRWGAFDAMDCILNTGLEYILAGVVPSEISAKAEIGALRAQAVAARGDILAKMGKKHAGEGFDVCSEQHCQVFSGENKYSIEVGGKIAVTAGYVLYDPRGYVLDAVYSSNCGGHSESNHFVWTTQPNPVLKGIWDHSSPPALDLTEEEQVGVFIRNPPACYCNNKSVEGGNRFRWERRLSSTDWKKVEDALAVGRIREIKDIARGLSGRIYRITFVAERGNKTVMKELNIRRLFGGLASSCFVADYTKDSSGFITGANLLGAGFGHGVGMCQTGAQSLAKKGWGFQQILSHYYSGSQLRKIY